MQLELYISWARDTKLIFVHVYPPKNKDQKAAQSRLRGEGFKLLEV